MTTAPWTLTFHARDLDADALAARLGVVADRARTFERSWYDTYDRRLWSSGLTLEVDRPGKPGERLTVALRDRATSAQHWVGHVGSMPTLAPDLPPGPWRRSLAKLIGLRALVPVASVRMSTARLAISDQQGKVVAEVLWEAPSGPLSAPIVRIAPLRGYEPEAEKVAATLARGVGLTPLTTHPFEVVANRVSIPPTGLGLVLEPELPIAETVRLLLRSLFEAMEPIEPWLAAPPDTEFLHEYRVALRRSRSVLKQAHGVLPAATLAKWRPRLRDLQQRTNLARDLDVFLLEWAGYRRMVPDEFTADLEPLHTLLGRLRGEEQVVLADYFGSVAHRKLRNAYRKFLAQAPVTEAASRADAATSSIAIKRIRRADRILLQAGQEITPQSPPSDLHELRILGKELRYALELYGSLFDPAALGALVKELKQLQDNLGEFQDSEVHSTQLRTFAERLGETDGRTVPTLMAVGVLISAFDERQTAARSEFADRFAAFSRPGHGERLEALLESRPTVTA